MKFNKKLIELRKMAGLSQEELGIKLNVARQTVSKWELGETTPEMEKLIKMSEIFNLSLDELVGKENIEKSENTNIKMHYEYKSKKKIKGIPLVHINVGVGFYKAKGIIAIGNISKGIISIGIIAMGLISAGAISIGILLSLGAMALGIISCGGLAIGGLALGGIAIGYLAIGGVAIGVYSLGGCAIASRIASGGYANAHIAIGEATNGNFRWNKISELPEDIFLEIKQRILIEYPNISKFILNIFS